MSVINKLKRSQNLRKIFRKGFNLLTHMPKKKRLIVFESFNGRQYSDSPRAIYEHMVKHYPEYEMVWSADSRFLNQFEGKGIRYVTRHSMKWVLLMTRASYWVTNARMPNWFRKSEDTIYLQTWHGTPLKRLGIDIDEVYMPGTTTDKYKKNFLFEASKWDYLVSANAYSTEIFKRAFGFNKKMLETGYPRNDFLQNTDDLTIQSIKGKISVPSDKKVILYAPTWRDDEYKKKGNYTLDIQLDLKRLKEELGDNHVILLRMHYLVSQGLDLNGLEGFVYDLSAYEDIRELYLIADMLITDYSSVFFDYSVLKKPILFFVYDIEHYRDQLRGFYFDLESNAPGPLLRTNDDLIAAIKEVESEGFKHQEQLEKFNHQFAYLEDGNATKRVVNEVFGRR